MTTVLISEHYRPRIGGVTTFIEQLSLNLRDSGNYVLLVPGNNRIGEVFKVVENGIEVYYFGTGIDLKGLISSDTRKQFCQKVSDWIVGNTESMNIAAVHILFGLYLMKYLRLEDFDKSIIRTCTIHNLPPQETGMSWKEDALLPRVKDQVRRRGVKWVNEKRIKAQRWDTYVVPSSYVSLLLGKLVPPDKIKIIGHGVDKVHNNERQLLSHPVRLLTVSGITPHKRIHKAVDEVQKLNGRGVKVDWQIVGPVKNERYNEFVNQQIAQNDLGDQIRLWNNVDDAKLDAMYKSADIYIHLSKEEGFCIAFLEALTYGLPAIGYDTGAIAKMVTVGRGILLDEKEDALLNAIQSILSAPKNYGLNIKDREKLQEVFNWRKAGQEYMSLWKNSEGSSTNA